MSSDNNQESLIKVVQDAQKSQILTAIGGGIQGLSTLAMGFAVIRQSYQKKRASPKVRLIRKQGRIAKIRLRHRTELEQEFLDLKTIKREAVYEAQMNQYQADLTSEPTAANPESQATGEGKNPKTLEGAVDKVKSGIKQVKEVSDQIKGLKDKFFGSDQEK
ncbi:MAG: hypothetical protein MRERV_48c005 [Mycoplasmataceae bacterium RV_VA103A]|nr:MAG: hypothetical protein MRERV_48c005 [Mycoplasmataceae bacterium RV_VA103A]